MDDGVEGGLCSLERRVPCRAGIVEAAQAGAPPTIGRKRIEVRFVRYLRLGDPLG